MRPEVTNSVWVFEHLGASAPACYLHGHDIAELCRYCAKCCDSDFKWWAVGFEAWSNCFAHADTWRSVAKRDKWGKEMFRKEAEDTDGESPSCADETHQFNRKGWVRRAS